MRTTLYSLCGLIVKCLPRLAYPVLRGPLRGTRFILGSPAGEWGGISIYFNKIEPEQTSVLSSMLSPGRVFFDIGANIGYYTVLAARRVGPQGRVIAFEPAIRNMVYLYRHLSINKIRNVTLIPAACSDQLSLQHFATGQNCATGHLVTRSDAQDATPVPGLTVDAVVECAGLSPHVMKIDVEGAELDVLKGARNTLLHARPELLLSIHSRALRKDCLAFLKDLEYDCTALGADPEQASEFMARANPHPGHESHRASLR